jgi:acetyl esterase/lipase
MRTLKDIRYGPEPTGNLLDLYLSEISEPTPVVVWSSGSGWMADDGKEGAAAIAPFFLERGYAVCGLSVRSSGQAIFPAQLVDIRAAFTWLREHGAENGLDPQRLAAMGNSSGGWVAVMAGLTAGAHAVVDFYGPTDFLQMDAHMPEGGAEFKAFLGIEGCHDDPGSPESRLVGGPIEERREQCARANPIAYVRPDAPPTMILHGQADPFVPHHQSELLFAALRAHGNHAIFYSLPGVKHEHGYVEGAVPAQGLTVREARDGREQIVEDAPPPSWDTIERFVRAALRRPSRRAAGMASR